VRRAAVPLKDDLSQISKVTRGGLWLYLDLVLTCFIGYLYWLVISRVAGPVAIGVASATIGLASIVGQACFLGIPMGVQRFFGGCINSGDPVDIGVYLGSSIAAIIVLSLVGGSVVLWAVLTNVLRVRVGIVTIAGVLILLDGVCQVLRSLFASALRTYIITLSSIVAGAARFVVGVSLVYAGWGGIGAAVGYIAATATALVVLTYFLFSKFNGVKLGLSQLASKEVVKAGLASWPGAVLSSVGMWLGVLVVFGAYGAAETGLYYVALAVASLVIALPQSILMLMYPLLSGMNEGGETTAWRATKLGLAISTPLSVTLALYPRLVLGLLGVDYLEASLELTVLSLSAAPIALFTGIWSFAYAYGYYRLVLALGLSQTAPRVLLYLWLARLGGVGAAYGFLAGSIIGAASAIVVAGKVGLKISWRDLSILVLVPAALGILTLSTHLPWFLGPPLIVFLSLQSYTRFNVVSREDLRELIQALLPRKAANLLELHTVFKILYGD